MAKGERKGRSALSDVVTREYTIHLHKRVHSKGFKHRAPSAIKAVETFAQKAMGTKLVKLDTKLNAAIWQRGIKDVPRRIRVRLERVRNDEENAQEKLLTWVYHVEQYKKPEHFRGLQTTVIEQED